MRSLSLGLTLCIAACGAAERTATADTAADTIHGRTVVVIGELDGPEEYLFSQIVGVAADAEGTVYVADASGSSVRAYSESGSYLGAVGREGDGPGEFQFLLHLIVEDGSRLHVRGLFRLSEFARSGGSQFADSLIGVTALDGIRTDRFATGRLSDSHYYSPGYVWEGFMRRGYYYEVYDRAGTVVDTLDVPPLQEPESTGLANYPVNEQGGMNVEGIARAPFEPRPSWDVDRNGHIWTTEGGRYEIIAVDPRGDTVRVITRPTEARAVPADERRDSLAAFEERLDSVPVPLDRLRGMSEMARRLALPEVLPEILGVRIDYADRLWVRRWPEGANETVYDVLSPRGTLLRVVKLPRRLLTAPAPWLSRERVIGVVADPVTEVERVAVFSIQGG